MLNNSISEGKPAAQVVYQLTEAQISELAEKIAAKIAETSTPVAQVLPETPAAPVWLSREDAAKRMGVSVASIHGLMRKGAIVYRKAGRRTLIDAQDLMAKIASGALAKYKRMQ